jgi:hypothetical protein
MAAAWAAWTSEHPALQEDRFGGPLFLRIKHLSGNPPRKTGWGFARSPVL